MADRKPTFISAIGISGFTWLNKPDTKFDAKGSYHTTLLYDGDEPGYEKMVAQVQAYADEQLAIFKADPANKKHLKDLKVDLPFKDAVDEEGEPTGQTKVKFKTSATDKDGKQKKVKLRDSRDKPCTATVYSGSKLRVMFTLGTNHVARDKTFYVTPYIVMVQVLALGEGGGGGGFGAVEGGYVGEEREERSFGNSSSDEGTEDSSADEENVDF